MNPALKKKLYHYAMVTLACAIMGIAMNTFYMPNKMLSGGIGGGAVSALAGAGIRLFAGTTGSADQAVLALLAGKLVHNPEAAKGHCGGHHYSLPC